MPRVGTVPIKGIAIALGKTNDVQPMTRPALTVMLAGKQPVQQGTVGSIEIRGSLLDESIHRCRLRRQAKQVKGGPANERPGVCGGGLLI